MKITETQLRTLIRDMLSEAPLHHPPASKPMFFDSFVKTLSDDEQLEYEDAIEFLRTKRASDMHSAHEWKRALDRAHANVGF